MPFFFATLFLAILPFHAFLITWLSSLFLGSGNDFLPYTSLLLASWKEIFMVIFGLCFAWKWLNRRDKLQFVSTLYPFDWLFLTFLAIALCSGFFITKDFGQMVWGLKYDFSFLVLFYLIRGLAFSAAQKQKLLFVFFGSALVSVIFGLVFYFLLPPEILTHFGYSSHISSFDVHKPLPAYHIVDGSDTPRMASSFSSPNHFGFYLIVVIAFALASLKLKVESLKLKVHRFWYQDLWHSLSSRFLKHCKQVPYRDTCSLIKTTLFSSKFFLLFIVHCSLLIALFFTFSRASWLAVVSIIGIFLLMIVPKKWQKIILFEGLGTVAILLVIVFFFAPNNLLRSGSNTDHFTHTRDAIHSVLQHHFGLGLGNAGPASMRNDELLTVRVPKAELQAISNAGLSDPAIQSIWYFDHGLEEQMAFKPRSRDELLAVPALKQATSSLQKSVLDIWNRYYTERIAENWHIQMFQEFGWLGGAVWLVFLGFFLFALFKKSTSDSLALGGFLALAGISIAGLFLHSFEDASVSLSLFFLLGLVDWE